MSAVRVEIRPMCAADIARVMEIAASVEYTPQWTLAAYLTVIDPIAAPRRIALVAESGPDGAVCGFAVARLLEPLAELETVAVAADRQRQGLGQTLLDRLAEELRKARMREMCLEVRISNRPAIGLYRRFGFHETGRRRGYYRNPVEDAVLMCLTLG